MLKSSLDGIKTPLSKISCFFRHPKNARLTCCAPAIESANAATDAVVLRSGIYEVDESRAHYLVASPPPGIANASVPPIILVHGFGAQSKHFSRNLAPLAIATGADVYAVDLLGFGRSEKPDDVLYGEGLWSWQVAHFVQTVVQRDKVFLAGNSVGGYVAMNVAFQLQSKVAGLILLNAAGRFGALNPLGFDVPFLQLEPVANFLGKILFDRARDPATCRKTLEQIYVDKSKVDDELLSWILDPASTPQAIRCGPVLFASLFMAQAGRKWEDLLMAERRGYTGPLLCVWGKQDPWIVPMYVEELQKIRPDLTLRWVDAGHCPHHERPEEVNAHIADWVKRLADHPADFSAQFQPRYKELDISLLNIW